MKRALCAAAGLVLVTDAGYVMAHRVFSLGVTLPLALGLGLLALAMQWDPLHARLASSARGRMLWRWGWAMFWLWLATVAVFFTWLAHAGSQATAEAKPAAAVIVLGSGTPGGQVSPTLAARLDAGAARAAAHPAAVLVASGGVDFGETRSEGAVMGDYLRGRGVALARIVQEERSTSTEQNLLFSRDLLRQRSIDVTQARTEIVTSDFHALRAGWIARRAGYADVRTVGASTPLYLRYNAWLREYFAVLSGFVLREY